MPKPIRPRGSSFGSKRLKPKRRPQRTESVQLTRLLTELASEFSWETHMEELPPVVQAELRAISERNASGAWTPRDLERVKLIHKNYIREGRK